MISDDDLLVSLRREISNITKQYRAELEQLKQDGKRLGKNSEQEAQ